MRKYALTQIQLQVSNYILFLIMNTPQYNFTKTSVKFCALQMDIKYYIVYTFNILGYFFSDMRTLYRSI